MADLEVREEGRVFVVTMNRPASRNAVNLPMAQEIARAMDRLDSEPRLSVGVITGAGGYFSAGMDLKAFAETGQRPHVPGSGFAGIVERPPEKPLIAAIEGFALAGGLEIALSCDLLVAARGSRLGIPEATRGLIASGGALLRLPQLLPQSIALELALTGEPIAAERAAELGMINALAQPSQSLDVALQIAHRVAGNAPLAVQASKQVLRQSRSWQPETAFDSQRPIADAIARSEDAREGARAFVEKRAPCWAGR